jgi:hypothetical protein
LPTHLTVRTYLTIGLAPFTKYVVLALNDFKQKFQKFNPLVFILKTQIVDFPPDSKDSNLFMFGPMYLELGVAPITIDKFAQFTYALN